MNFIRQYVSQNYHAGILMCACVIALLLYSTAAFSKNISVTLPNKIIANADYRQGEAGKPAVFILHGFMSTYNLNVVQNIANELSSNGYTTLAPTLSLNVNNRHSGASCEAVHTHTMEGDVEEIRWWLQWLESKGHRQVVVIGHSTGSLQLAITLANNPPTNVTKAILTAPAYLKGKPFPLTEEKADLKIANDLKAKNNNKLHKYHMSYCKGNFVSPYNVYLSYKAWSRHRLVETVKKVKVPHVIIMGEEDHRFGPLLTKMLKSTNSRILTVKGANHFFSSPYEFDFLDTVTAAIK